MPYPVAATRGSRGTRSGVTRIHYDTFTEAGNPALTAHSPEVGNGYQQSILGTGTFAVLSATNVLDVSGTGSYRYAWTVLDQAPGQIKVDWRQPNAFTPMGILFRVQDENNFWVVTTAYNTNDMWLKKAVAGTPTTLDEDLNVVHSAETWYTMWIDFLAGNVINVYHATQGSTKPGSPILTSSGDGTHAEDLGVGFYIDTNSQRFDNLNVWDVKKE